MHDTLPRLINSTFPALRRQKLETLQVNLGYKCNQQCFHCHVNASPKRKEMMSDENIFKVIKLAVALKIQVVDLTGGAPELHAKFRYLVNELRARDIKVIDRCNLTILNEPDQTDLAQFLAQHKVEVVASLPCYTSDNVNMQRGDGVFESSIQGLLKLNKSGFGQDNSGLILNLVYNPVGAFLPPSQSELELDYKRELYNKYGIVFNNLFTITNMPIKRFGSTLVSSNQFSTYMNLLKNSHNPCNLQTVMCRNLVSIDWQGNVYDCDFNQMLGLNMCLEERNIKINDLLELDLARIPVKTADHCYGCTAGSGSSCGGALA